MSSSIAPRIPPFDTGAAAIASKRAATLARPPGSLGRLEQLAVRIAGMRGGWDAPLGPSKVAIFAADHGVSAAGVSAYPSSVTGHMLRAFADGGATVNALARTFDISVSVIDVGVIGRHAIDGVLEARVAAGTSDLSRGPAMTREQAAASVSRGIDAGLALGHAGAGLIAGGEMGIGNTTAASAIVAAATGADPATVVGRGTGIDDERLRRKVEIVDRALRERPLDARDGLGILASVGGFEIGALAGLYLASASRRVPIVLDGAISAAAALVASALGPAVGDYLIAGHQSTEPSHVVALRSLGLTPLLDLDMRLGEASGAVLAMPLVRAAVVSLQATSTLDDVLSAEAARRA